MRHFIIVALLISFSPHLTALESSTKTETIALFKKHCAACHGETRLGGIGPALLPENLKRLRKNKAVSAIANGLPATQMPAFGKDLTTEDIKSLVNYIFTPAKTMPVWGKKEIKTTHIIHNAKLLKGDATTATPNYKADPLNVFLVVEAGDHHVTVLDGDKMEPIHRFKSRYALHGGPKYSSDGRFVYFASREGWITKYDMYQLEVVAEVRAGINTRNAAVSADDRYVMVGNYLPHNMVLLDANDLSLVKVIAVEDELGESSRVSGVYTAPPRESFVVALKDLKEVWEVSYDKDNNFPIRRIQLNDYLDDFFFDQSYRHLIGTSRTEKNGQVVDLDAGEKIAEIDLPGMPHLGSGITWNYKDTVVLASPNIERGLVTIIDMNNWKTLKKIETKGPGFFMRSHENSRYAWVDVFMGENKDIMHVIDKQTLEIAKTLKPMPGKTSGHIEFTRDGKYALLSIWEKDGYIIVYDGDTLEEVKRLPMSKPVGKYNVFNKITRSEGTSH